ncbi:MAG: M24 family metallopeptidase [Candidatus Nanohaloarchaea archaeon]
MNADSKIDDFLESSKFDAFLIFDDSASNENLFYLTSFKASDSFLYFFAKGESTVVVPQLEYSRAEEEAEVDNIYSSSKYVSGESRDNESKRIETIRKALEDKGINRVAVPGEFPLKLADDLESEGIEVEPAEQNPVMEARKRKDSGELEKLREVQELTEEAMKRTREIIGNAEVRDGVLYRDGEILTSERVKKKIKLFMLENNCEVPENTIVASGAESAKPHSRGSGPIEAGEPIIVDIFPRHDNNYFGDMTRTFVKGEVPSEVQEMKQSVDEALEAAFEVLERGAGVKAKEVHARVCDVLEKHGYETLRNNEEAESGFLHSTGHAVGLELHESPRVAGNKDELEEGMVLTIEPGLYIPEIGGLRLEDMIVVEEDGFENFNSMSREIKLD